MIAEAEAPPDYLTADEVAALCRVSRHTVYNWINRGITKRGRLIKLVADEWGDQWRIPRAAFDAFYEAQNPGRESPLAAKERKRAQRQDEEWLEERGVMPRVTRKGRP